MTPTWYERRILLGCMTLAAAVTAGTLLLADFAQEPDQDLTLNMAAAAPAPAHQQAVNQPALVSDAPESADLERVKLSQQSFQRGGMGSRALMAFTVRNANAYDIKDLELLCAFRSRDGRYTTERRKRVADTVRMKSRKAFPTMLVGHVNVRADKARCSLVTASRR
jgi:hypothetical protein